MYREEKIIDGVLHLKSVPNGEWYQASNKVLTSRLKRAEDKLNELRLLAMSDEDPNVLADKIFQILNP